MRDRGEIQREARSALATVLVTYALSITLMLVLVGLAAILAAIALISGRLALGILTVPLVVAVGALGRGLFWRGSEQFPPHVVVDPMRAPALIEMIRAVAERAGTKAPDRVLIAHGCNAAVGEIGPVMGTRKRILVLGAGTLSTLTVSELRAVIAHELGHFSADEDDPYGSRVYATRHTLARITNEARRSGGDDDVIYQCYRWLFRRFEAKSARAMREQELFADSVAARVAGTDVARSALERMIEGDAALVEWSAQLAAVASIGYPANEYDGFRRFFRSPRWAEQREAATHAARSRPASPLDTHPPIDERLTALAAHESSSVASDDQPATSLVREIDAIERELCAKTRDARLRTFDAHDWPLVLAAQHRDTAARVQARAPALDFAMLVAVIADPSRSRELLYTVYPTLIGLAHDRLDDELRTVLARAATSYAASLLIARGWSVCSALEEPLALARDEQRIAIESLVRRATADATAADDLRRAVWAGGVIDGDRIALQPAEAEAHTRRASPVAARQHTPQFWEVLVQLRTNRWPRCCVVCKAAVTHAVSRTINVPVSDSIIPVPIVLPVCGAHANTAHEHLRLREYDARNDVATFDTKDAVLAQLIERVNA